MLKKSGHWVLLATICLAVWALLTASALYPLYAAHTTPQSSPQVEQVKLFSMAVTQHENLNRLETDINDWLKTNADKIEVLARTQSSAGQYRIDVAIWYRNKK